jgi:hypothetical protein
MRSCFAREKPIFLEAFLEFIGGDTSARLKHVCALWRRSRDVRPNCALAVCNAGKIRDCGERRSRKLRVRHEPQADNEAYAAIRRLPRDNSDPDLPELLAAEAVVSLSLVKDLPP